MRRQLASGSDLLLGCQNVRPAVTLVLVCRNLACHHAGQPASLSFDDPPAIADVFDQPVSRQPAKNDADGRHPVAKLRVAVEVIRVHGIQPHHDVLRRNRVDLSQHEILHGEDPHAVDLAFHHVAITVRR